MPKKFDPPPTEFLPAQPGRFSAVPKFMLTKAGKEVFPQVDLKSVIVGRWYYVTFAIHVEEESTEWGYMATVLNTNSKAARFHFTQGASTFTGVEEESEEKFLDLDTSKSSKHSIFEILNMGPAPAEPVASADPLLAFSEAQIDALLEADKSIQKTTSGSSTDQKPRLNVLKRTIMKLLSLFTGVIRDEDVEQAIDGAKQEAIDALEVKDDSAMRAPLAMGQTRTNIKVVQRVIALLKHPVEQNDMTKLFAEIKLVKLQLAELTKVAKLASLGELTTADKPTEEIFGDMVSMTPDGKCCWQASGATLSLTEDSSVDRAHLLGDEKVLVAKQTFVQNVLKINKILENEWSCGDSPSERAKESERLWREVIGKSPSEVLREVLDGKKYGGFIEVAATMWDTDVEPIIIHADEIHAQASDKSVEVAIHSAMLSGLPAGVTKKRKTFLILEGKHYLFGFTIKGGQKKAIIKIGAEADQAQKAIVKFLKQRQAGPLESLSETDQLAQISKAFKEQAKQLEKPSPQVMWPDIETNPGPRTSVPSGHRPGRGRIYRRPAKCLFFDAYGSCKHGDDCKFTHDDGSTTPKQREQFTSRGQSPASRSHSPAQRQKGRTMGTATAGNRPRQIRPQPPEQLKQSRTRKQPSDRSRSPKQRDSPTVDRQLQPLRSTKSCLRIQSKADLSAGEWRNQLKTIDAETHALTSWVSRSSDGKYYFIHSNLANNKELLSRLAPLRKLQLKVDRVSHESTKDQQSPERPTKPHCAAILSGRECTCKPRCY